MKELSLNILDITGNSIKAKAQNIGIFITETDTTLTLVISDDGTGMKPDVLQRVTDPFTTSRTTRKVGLGLPFLKLAAEQTGGSLEIVSRYFEDYPADHGTVVTALFYKKHIDFTPLGDIVSTIVTLIQGSPEIDFLFRHTEPERTVELSTKEMREVLGEVALNSIEVIEWVRENLTEQYNS